MHFNEAVLSFYIITISKEKLLQMKIVLAFIAFISPVIGNAQVKVGDMAPEIALPGVKGDSITLSSFKGKIVLIDFWASWCAPCRASNPRVVKLYNKYKSQGFEVFGVSIDSKKSAWLKAIKHDNLTYTQVNDDGGWDARTTLAYGVDAIPATFMLDKEGKVVAIDLEGKALEAKVKAMLEEK